MCAGSKVSEVFSGYLKDIKLVHFKVMVRRNECHMIKLMPVIFENYDCVQAIIANVLNHYKMPWQLMFIGVIGFDYSKLDGGGFILHTGGKAREVLEKIYGIRELPFAAKTIIELKNSINNNDLLCLYIDGYYCPWHSAFNKYHIEHFLLAVGFSDSNNTIICADPFFTTDLKELPIQYVTFTQTNFVIRMDQNEIVDLNSIHNKSICCLKSTIVNIFKSTKLYWETINDFSKYLSLEGLRKELYDCKDSSFIKWLISIDFISKARNCFIESLRYLDKLYKIDFNVSINDFQELSKEWTKLRLCLLKHYYKQKCSFDVLQNIKLQIKSLSEKEKIGISNINECLANL